MLLVRPLLNADNDFIFNRANISAHKPRTNKPDNRQPRVASGQICRSDDDKRKFAYFTAE